ncbi:MAG: LuxR family transcriptional regulator [Bacteroidales bacterium]|jgi:DNA-binding CsgD family transcriptional regulator|nr:LuxR family transcriptional regulator [Bacteroidales bacterium]
MSIINETTVLSEVLAQHHMLIPIINRFGIKLGVGDKTIENICEEQDLNVDFILTILNVYLDDKYISEKKLAQFDLEPIANYFNETIQNYLHSLVPNIEKHLHAFIALSESKNDELKALQKVFFQFKEELVMHLEKGLNHTGPYPHELLRDIKSILIKHVSGNFNQNLCYAVIFSVGSLESDLIIHNRLRNSILKPKLNELNSSDIGSLQHIITNGNHKPTKKKLLTKRETEILRLIVRGNLNKQIADQLNISLNTVLTHRKNILSKTGIKTVSGLTLYCISNGLLSPDEVKMN